MDSQTSNTPGLGLPPSGSEMDQLPSIHAPETFRAPEGAIPHFAASPSSLIPQAPPASITQPLSPPSLAPSNQAAPPQVPDFQARQAASATQLDDTDNAFDEEWADKAREVVAHTHTDPYVQSKELGKLKAQYIKARYNKDIKVSED